MLRIIKIAVVGILLSVWSENVQAKLFDAHEFSLANGLRVIVVPNHKAPIIKQMIWYRVGSMDERPYEHGIAHLLEHLMFRGTRSVDHDTYNRVTQVNGIVTNAFTGQNFTAYHHTMDIRRLELALFLEADRMQHLDLSPSNFALERDIVFQERKQVVENDPASHFDETMQHVMWGEHPYSRPITGLPEEIKQLRLEDVRQFYRRYYAPNNAILVLSGDIDIKTAKILVQKYFGKLKASEEFVRTPIPGVSMTIPAKLEMSLPDIQTVRLVNTWITPQVKKDYKDLYKLDVLSSYLGEGKTSQLYQMLVKKKKVALAVSSGFGAGFRSYGTFSIGAIPAEEVDAKQLQQELDKALDEAIQNMTLATIENTKQKMLSGLVFLRDNPSRAAMMIGRMAISGMNLAEIENYEQNIRNVQTKDVKEIAQKLLLGQARIEGVLTPLETKND